MGRRAVVALTVGSLLALIVPASPGGAAAPGAQNGSLLGVVCPTSATCVAVGTYRDATNNAQPLVAQSHGTSWKFTAAPVPPPAAGLQVRRGLLAGISCPTTTKCFAVGNYTDGITKRPVIEQWDGARWTIVSRLRPKEAVRATLSGVSCPASNTCLAVGTWDDTFGVTKTLAVQWNGTTWVVVPTPREDREAHDAKLFSIACVSATSCVAVGSFTRSQSGGSPLTERWDGKHFIVVPVPKPPRPLRYFGLFGASCASRDACAAVGFAADSSGEPNVSETLAERWTGTRWFIAPAPKVGVGHYLTLYGVECPSATSCLAVGERTDISNGFATHRTLAERWDGKTWSLMTGLDATRGLNGISCRSTTDCVAVGGSKSPEIAWWNGTTWSVVDAS